MTTLIGRLQRGSPLLWHMSSFLAGMAVYVALESPPLSCRLAREALGTSPRRSELVPWPFEVRFQLPSWAWCNHPACPYSQLNPRAADPSSVNQSAVGFTGQDLEDQYIYEHIFHGMRGGFYLEMGALDGVGYSNTRFLAQAAGWRGLLIEPDPESYAKLVENRPEAISVNTAICSEYRRVHYVYRPGGVRAVNGIYEFMDPAFRARWHGNISSPQGLPELPCLPLMAILDRLGIDTIDLWSLDVEGAELEVLRTVDFSRLRVNAMVVEADGHNATKDAAVSSLIASAGLVAVHQQPGRNIFYVHSSFLPHMRALAR